MPQTMINEVTPIVVDGDYFNCNGGGDTLTGHPIEMIKVDSPWPAVCKYCGLRYISREHAHKSAEWAHLVGVRALPPPPICPPRFGASAAGLWAVLPRSFCIGCQRDLGCVRIDGRCCPGATGGPVQGQSVRGGGGGFDSPTILRLAG